MLVDIDVPAGERIIFMTREDGSSTVSVPQAVFEAAANQMKTNIDQAWRGLAGFRNAAHAKEFVRMIAEQA